MKVAQKDSFSAAFRPDKTDPETILLVPSEVYLSKLQLNQRHL